MTVERITVKKQVNNLMEAYLEVHTGDLTEHVRSLNKVVAKGRGFSNETRKHLRAVKRLLTDISQVNELIYIRG